MQKVDKKNIFSSVRDYCKEQEMLIRDLFDSFALIVLSLYPFRNIHNGLDLWDTGYNYSNFEYIYLRICRSFSLLGTDGCSVSVSHLFCDNLIMHSLISRYHGG